MTKHLKTSCGGCCADIDCDCVKVCDEGDYCARHHDVEEKYWANYFGSNYAQMKPQSNAELTEQMREARKLK